METYDNREKKKQNINKGKCESNYSDKKSLKKKKKKINQQHNMKTQNRVNKIEVKTRKKQTIVYI